MGSLTDGGVLVQTANTTINTDNTTIGSSNVWNFNSTTGNLTLPGNTFAVNYANGDQVSLGGTSNTIQEGPSLAYIDGVGGNFVVSISDSDSVWTFGVGGDITFPGGGVQHGAYGGPDFPSVTGNSSKYLYTDGTQLLWETVSGGNGSPGGNTTEIQYNSNGAFAGSDAFTFDGGNITITGANFVANPGAYILEVYGANAFMGSFTDGGVLVENATTTINTGNTVIGSTGSTWTFDNTGNLTLPGNTFTINYANGAQAQLGGYIANFIFPTPSSNTSTIGVNDGSDIVINPTYGGSSPAYINVPGSINGPTTEALQIYNGYSLGNGSAAAVSIGASAIDGITIFGDGSVVTSNTLTVPASDNGSIIFSDNGTDNNGSLKVDGGLNMTLSANSNFYVKQAGQDRLAITDGNTDLMGSTNVVIHSNKAGTEYNWVFSNTGSLAVPGNITNANVISANVVNTANVNTDFIYANNGLQLSGVSANILMNGGYILGASEIQIGNTDALLLGQNAVLLMTGNSANYVEAALINQNSNSSGDFTVYADNGNADAGYVDMGITGSAYNVPNTGLTQPGDGYFIVSGVPTSGGNLIIATAGTGSNNDIVFGNGYDTGNEVMRFENTLQTFQIKPNTVSSNTTTGALTVAGGVGIGGDLNIGGNLTLPNNSVINETTIVVSGANTTAITLTPATGSNADQKLLVYPTILSDNNHLHLTSGNLYNTELYFGNDDLYVKLANTGNIIINSNNGNGNSGQWEFGVDATYGFGLLKGTGNGGGLYTDGDFVGVYAEDLNHNGIEMFANSHTTIQGVSNVAIHTNTGTSPLQSWIFDDTGNLTLPGNTFAINYANGQQVPISGGGGSYGDSNVVTLLASYGSNTITTTGNVTTGNANIGGNLILASSSVITSVSGSNANINIDPDGTGAVVINGNIVANGVYANITNPTSGGTLTIASNAGPTSTTRIYSSASTVIYNNVSGVPVQALAITAAGIGTYANISPGGNIVMAAGKNISSTNGSNANINIDPDGTGNVNIVGNANVSANISANYFIGNGSQLTGVNVSLIGNVTGTTPNVTLVAGSYNYVFDNTGNFTLPTNGDLIFSANTTLGSVAGSNGNITINPDGTGQLIVTSTTPAVFGNTLNVSGNITASGSAGVITPNRPAFRVYGSSGTIWSTTTNTNGILNANNWTVDYNQGGYLNSSTGVFTAPVAGLYQLNLVCRVANNTSLSAQAIVIKNYGSGNVNQVMWESANNPTINHFGVSTVSKLAAGDTLTLKVTVGSLIFDGNDNWSVAYLG